jgi:acyl dehydratase
MRTPCLNTFDAMKPPVSTNTLGSFVQSLEELRGFVGREAFVTDWVEISQARIDLFAQATEDYQWIHVDEARAPAEGPFGGTIAHGFLTLSLLGKFAAEYMALPFCAMGINYGVNKVRFTHPVRAGSRVRGRFTLKELSDIDNGVQMIFTVHIEIDGVDRPACVAESVTRQYFAPQT